MPFDAVLRADSECHIHFAIKLINNNENLYETNCCKNPEKIKLEIKKSEKQISKREISKQQNPEKKYRN